MIKTFSHINSINSFAAELRLLVHARLLIFIKVLGAQLHTAFKISNSKDKH